jgi:hypothetical protein
MSPRRFHLSAELLKRCAAVFDRHPRYSVADMAIKKVLAAIPANNELSHVVAKVSLIKTLYATPIYDVFAVAESVVLPRFQATGACAGPSFPIYS